MALFRPAPARVRRTALRPSPCERQAVGVEEGRRVGVGAQCGTSVAVEAGAIAGTVTVALVVTRGVVAYIVEEYKSIPVHHRKAGDNGCASLEGERGLP